MSVNHGTWVGLVTIAFAGLVLAGDSKKNGHPQAQGGCRFLKVGPYYINTSRILYVAIRGDSLRVVFGAGERPVIGLRGDDADILLSWLQEHSAEGTSPSAAESRRGRHEALAAPDPARSHPGSDGLESRPPATGPQRLHPQSGYFHKFPKGTSSAAEGFSSDSGTSPPALEPQRGLLQGASGRPDARAWGHLDAEGGFIE